MQKKEFDEKPKVELIAYSMSSDEKLGPEEISVYGAKGCFEESSSIQLFREDIARLNKEEIEAEKEKIFRETSGRGHGSVIDQNSFIFSIEDLPRAATLQLCLPEYLAHEQQSLRRVCAERGYFLPESLKQDKTTIKLLGNSFKVYAKMQGDDIPAEDARYILPIATRTNIQTLGNARELMHLHSMSMRDGVPKIISETVEKMIFEASKIAPKLFKNRGTNYEVLSWFPSSQLFTRKNNSLEDYVNQKSGKIELIGYSFPGFITEKGIERAVKERDEVELANLKHIHYTFLVPMSLSSFHQATRQRTWNQSTESIYNSARRGNYIIPPSIEKSRHILEYSALISEMLNNYHFLVKKGIPAEDAVLTLPHALEIHDLIHINGWNALHSIGKRTCKTAQWEIRNIAKQIASCIKEKNPELGKYCLPQGFLYGKCPERNACGLCKNDR